MTDSLPQPAPKPWQHPLVLCVLVAVALVAIGDAYPISPFPMYSNIDTSANMLLVTNEKDEPLPLSRLFNSGSAQLKKRFEKVLKEKSGTSEYQETTAKLRSEAGEAFLKSLWDGRDKGDVAKLPSQPQTLRLKIRTMSMEKNGFRDEMHVMAELNVVKAAAEEPKAEEAEEGGNP